MKTPDAPPPLSPAERVRYGRHLLLAEVGEDGQRRLKAARVLLVGAGGLGAPVALYLAAAGVGTIGVVDADVVDPSNLQRQVIYTDADLGQSKAATAAAALRARNPHINVVEHPVRLTASNAVAVAAGYDLIVDGSDNFATRYLINDLAVLTGRRVVYGAIFRFDGQVTVFGGEGPCYRCLHPAPPPAAVAPNCAEAGVLGVLPGLVGMVQATEVVKLLLGQGRALAGRLLMVDALEMRFVELGITRDPGCAVCGARPSIASLADTLAACGLDAAQSAWDVGVEDYAAAPFGVLVDVRTAAEAAVEGIGGRLIPLDTLGERMNELRGARVVVHCQMGGRSARAVEVLRADGIEAHNLRGGIEAWKAAGLPVRRA
ncbi:MAG: molybdopterin-synthase adenylyltransferase MoeB [Myxococcales bacterium]|nr:molybdopterin-synthase adenylyltransferase MoeB [Myxococcales bacterium]